MSYFLNVPLKESGTFTIRIVEGTDGRKVNDEYHVA